MKEKLVSIVFRTSEDEFKIIKNVKEYLQANFYTWGFDHHVKDLSVRKGERK